MARIRTIKPEFWTDEKIVQLPYEWRLLYIGLWNFADDEGCLNYEPSRLKMEIFPSDTIDVEEGLDYLEALKFIDFFESDQSSRFIQINSFQSHQVISHKTPSRIVPKFSRKLRIPDGVRRQIATKYGCLPGASINAECYFCGSPGKIIWTRLTSGKPSAWIVLSGLEYDHFIAESQGGETIENNIVLACRSCNRSKKDGDPITLISRRTPGGLQEDSNANGKEGKGRERKGREKDISCEMSDRRSLNGQTRFYDWWNAYPKDKRIAKKRALEIWRAKHLDEGADELIADVMERMQRDQKWIDGYIPNPTTYLNQHRWEDAYTPVRAK